MGLELPFRKPPAHEAQSGPIVEVAIQDAGGVLDVIHGKAAENPEYQNKSTALIMLGSASMWGVEAAFFEEFIKAKLHKGVDAIFCISAASIVTLLGLAGKEGNLAELVEEFIEEDEMIHPKHILHKPTPGARRRPFNTEGLMEFVKTLVDPDKLRFMKPEINVGVTRDDTGEQEWIFLNYHDDPIPAVKASSSMPYVANSGLVEIRGKRYADGGAGHESPHREVLKRYDNVLILSPVPLQWKNPTFRDVLLQLLTPLSDILPPSMAKNVANHIRSYRLDMEDIQRLLSQDPGMTTTHIAFASPTKVPPGFEAFCTDYPMLSQVRKESQPLWKQALAPYALAA